MKGNMEERAVQLALYIIEHKATVRAAAQKFGISKSTVHKDLSERLPGFNRPLYHQVKRVLDENKAQRHIRGGIATREKYRHAHCQAQDGPSGAQIQHQAYPLTPRAAAGRYFLPHGGGQGRCLLGL